MSFRPAILYVDDEQANLDTFKRAFGADFLVRTCLSGSEALTVLDQEDFPLIIVDQRMPGMSGIELCEQLIRVKHQSIRMILTAYTEPELLMEAINRGHVHDYLVKPWRKSEIKPIIEKAFNEYKEKQARLEKLEAQASRVTILEEEIRSLYDSSKIVGSASGLKGVSEIIAKAGPSEATLLILGETGTGKELIARAFHESSHRKKAPFIAVHCAALTSSLLESELFGHEKGAFTGADQVRIGRFEAASGGTLFLDEIGEIPESVQVKLLRVLQEKEIQRVGGNRTVPIDVRIIAATNKDLKQKVQEGTFRDDLYFRLNVIPVTVPPLRDRKADIHPLARHFLEKFNRQTGKNLQLSATALEDLNAYDWPGNVRELQNIIERAVILSSGLEIEPDDLNLNLDELLAVDTVDLTKTMPTVRDEIQNQEAQKLSVLLRQVNGNISQAARQMGVARSTLFHRLKKYHLI